MNMFHSRYVSFRLKLGLLSRWTLAVVDKCRMGPGISFWGGQPERYDNPAVLPYKLVK